MLFLFCFHSAVWDESRCSSSHFAPWVEGTYWGWWDRKLDLLAPNMITDLLHQSQNVYCQISLHNGYLIILLKLFHLGVFCISLRILSNIPSDICWKSIIDSWSAFLLITLDYDDVGHGSSMCGGAGRKTASASTLGKMTSSKAVLFCRLLSELPLSRNASRRLLVGDSHLMLLNLRCLSRRALAIIQCSLYLFPESPLQRPRKLVIQPVQELSGKRAWGHARKRKQTSKRPLGSPWEVDLWNGIDFVGLPHSVCDLWGSAKYLSTDR